MVVEGLPERGLVLVSGPSRGGKSAWAEHLALQWAGPVAYLATGPNAASDPAWAERVEQHQRRRPADWRCHEVGGALIELLLLLGADQGQASGGEVERPLLLIESLGTWLAWHLEDSSARWHARSDQLLEALQQQPGPVVVVVEETGWGVVPATVVGGLFRDRLGALQQELMQQCHTAWLVVAGRALNLSSLGHPVPPAH